MNLLEQLRECRLVPVADIASAAGAVQLAGVLVEAGLSCLEITLRTDAAEAAIRAVAAEVPEILLGAGTVRNRAQAERVVEAGARFLVAPGLQHTVVERALELGVPIMPGVCTPTEVDAALEMGIGLLKFFPAEPAGGVAYLSALAGPYRDVSFVPTGGITLANLPSYLALPTVAACGGSWMVKSALVEAGDFATISKLAAEALTVARAAAGGRG